MTFTAVSQLHATVCVRIHHGWLYVTLIVCGIMQLERCNQPRVSVAYCELHDVMQGSFACINELPLAVGAVTTRLLWRAGVDAALVPPLLLHCEMAGQPAAQGRQGRQDPAQSGETTDPSRVSPI